VPSLTAIAEGILSHHEYWDGTGYPRGLKGEQIPVLARILAIVDAYDVMTNGRPYKKAISHDEAIAELRRCAGTQFDPRLVQLFIETFNDRKNLHREKGR
jgi:HD-GYP domain-containing protein (c-di-GMP phosphodiesterase class II)